jgi:hypothetical protein
VQKYFYGIYDAQNPKRFAVIVRIIFSILVNTFIGAQTSNTSTYAIYGNKNAKCNKLLKYNKSRGNGNAKCNKLLKYNKPTEMETHDKYKSTKPRKCAKT